MEVVCVQISLEEVADLCEDNHTTETVVELETRHVVWNSEKNGANGWISDVSGYIQFQPFHYKETLLRYVPDQSQRDFKLYMVTNDKGKECSRLITTSSRNNYVKVWCSNRIRVDESQQETF